MKKQKMTSSVEGFSRWGAWVRNLVLAAVASFIFLSGTHYAHATVIYDWVTQGSSSDDGGENLHAEWTISDQEYFDGLFTTLTPGTTVSVSLEAHTYPYGLPCVVVNTPRWNEDYTFGFGLLSYDKKTITHIYDNFGGDAIYLYDSTMDGGVRITSTRIWGDAYSVDPWYWDKYGYWELRDGTAPAVPEPGTCILLLTGLGGLALWRRQKLG